MRKIIHIDMDAFYASVEVRDNPSLRGKPLIVGGLPHSRGVVATCSYEARKFGIHSGMASSRAHQLCPEAIFLPPRFDAYRAASNRIRSIFLDYTDLVEPLSLDEAYLDVTVNKRGIPYATRTAREIKKRIRRETGGLTASAGVSYNMFLAKIASDLHKPNGLTVIRPEDAHEILMKLPIGKFFGIGPVTEKSLTARGIRIGADLFRLSLKELCALLGKSGEYYYGIVRGNDDREVMPEREHKSLGTECTFEHDITDMTELVATLAQQSAEVADDLRKNELAGKTITLKVKYFNFRTVTRSRSLDSHIDDAETIGETARNLLLKTEAGTVPVRLIGVTVSNFHDPKPEEKEDANFFQPEFDFGEEL
ncbi:MAG: DNA polymerase IV [Lentisphaerae bacterium ADurb.Bin242]|nr:MAG: DNA polymerase IV [Lentisphaerae bacterium ADurb.Bin242]